MIDPEHSQEGAHEALRRWRLAAGLSQGAAGNQIGGLTQALVSQWETGRKQPARTLWPDIAAVYGVTLQEVTETLTHYRVVARTRLALPAPATPAAAAAGPPDHNDTLADVVNGLLDDISDSVANAYGTFNFAEAAAAQDEYTAVLDSFNRSVAFCRAAKQAGIDSIPYLDLTRRISEQDRPWLPETAYAAAMSYVWRLRHFTVRNAAIEMIEAHRRVNHAMFRHQAPAHDVAS